MQFINSRSRFTRLLQLSKLKTPNAARCDNKEPLAAEEYLLDSFGNSTKCWWYKKTIPATNGIIIQRDEIFEYME